MAADLAPRADSSRHRLPGAALLVATVGAAYWNSRHGVMVFDDQPTLLLNESSHAFATAWIPQAGGITTSGRPLLNLTFALNYAVSGLAVEGYHLLNGLIHAAAALTLWGILRRVPWVGATAALLGALLWAVHPLQTESVTYLVQRAESLAGLFYLLTFYCFLRWNEQPGERRWKYASLAACALGMLTKEILVTAPVMLLLFDRTLLSGSFRAAFARRGSYYRDLSYTWLIQVYLVVRTGTRGGTSGFGLGIGWWQYGQTQFRTLWRYLALSLWPHPLVIDYGVQWEKSPGPVLGYGLAAAALVGLVLFCLLRPASSRLRAVGFAGAWILLLLAPTSLIPGTRQTMAEHRMYLPLAAVTVLVAVLAVRWLGRAAWVAGAALALALIVFTVQRNRAYAGEAGLWADTVRHVPQNPYAWNNLGVTLEVAGYPAEAKAAYLQALVVQPNTAQAANNLGDLARAAGDLPEAVARYQQAIRSKPDYFNPRYSLGELLLRLNRMPEAAEQFAACLTIQPGFAGAELGWGDALAQAGRYGEAEAHLRSAIAFDPRLTMAYNDLGNVLGVEHRFAESIAMYDRALQLNPNFADAKRNRAITLAREQAVPAK